MCSRTFSGGWLEVIIVSYQNLVICLTSLTEFVNKANIGYSVISQSFSIFTEQNTILFVICSLSRLQYWLGNDLRWHPGPSDHCIIFILDVDSTFCRETMEQHVRLCIRQFTRQRTNFSTGWKFVAFRCSAHTELLTLTVRKFRRLAVDQSSVWTGRKYWTVPRERSDRLNFLAGV